MARPGQVDAVATWSHYVDHLAPVWKALPPEHRGTFYVPTGARGRITARHAATLGILTETLPSTPSDRLTLVAAVVDHQAARARGRPVAYQNHGVGQAWRRADGNLIPSGVGNPKPGTSVFLAPGPFAAAVTREVHPDARVEVVGVPKLDHQVRSRPPHGRPLVVFSTHWDHTVVPEARSALAHYAAAIEKAARAPDVDVALHAHPRVARTIERLATRARIPYIYTFAEVLERATAYATDSSSTLFEFAATGRPVLVLNAPTYRREHQHGLRFWEAATVGVNVDHPDELPAAVRLALADPPAQREARARALAIAYAPLDGRATQRAVAALLATIEEAA